MKRADVVTVTTVVPLPPAQAFTAFTDEVDDWWGRGPAFRFGGRKQGVIRFEPGVGGRLVEDYGGGDVFEVGRVTAWEPGVHLALTWRGPNFGPDESTWVRVAFEPSAAGTRVTLEHGGWSGLPPAHPVRHGQEERAFYTSLGGVWQRRLAGLSAYAARNVQRAPRPDGAR